MRIPVSLNPSDALKLLASADEDPHDFRVCDSSRHHRTIELWVDGNPTPTKVTLHSGGTWTLMTEVSL